tara:strand:- start:194 stop:505 length:312 start_codon:yes stop_codon:yes gene_type:complete
MKKISLVSILILMLVTSLVKNSTKEIEDKIFTKNENIRSLKIEFEDEKLEFNYLSSPKKLTQYQSKYFENDLSQIDIMKVKKMLIEENYLKVIDFKNKFQTNE